MRRSSPVPPEEGRHSPPSSGHTQNNRLKRQQWSQDRLATVFRAQRDMVATFSRVVFVGFSLELHSTYGADRKTAVMSI